MLLMMWLSEMVSPEYFFCRVQLFEGLQGCFQIDTMMSIVTW